MRENNLLISGRCRVEKFWMAHKSLYQNKIWLEITKTKAKNDGIYKSIYNSNKY